MSDCGDVHFVNFNQDASSLSVGTRRGYALYSLASVDELPVIHENESVGDACLVERLFSSSLVTLVSLTAPRKLRVCHFQKGTEICSHSYTNTVLSVRLNRLRVAVCLAESLYIHNIRDMKVLHTIRDTPPNPQGICDMASSDASYLAYPGAAQIGELQIFDAANLQAVSMISAHDSPLAAIKFNDDGSKVATASEKGTVIRVFAVPGGERLFEFRRGMKRCVQIHSLAFSPDSLHLASSSNTETVHVFRLDEEMNATHNTTTAATANDAAATARTRTYSTEDEAVGSASAALSAASSAAAGWMDYVSKTATAYLPTQMTDILQQDRSFATARLPSHGIKNVVALVVVKQVLRLLAASTDGYLYIYNVDRTLGGECTLVKQHRFAGADARGGGSRRLVTPAADSNSYANAVGDAPTNRKQQAQGNADNERRLDQAVASANSAAQRLRLDDDREFPPMTHSTD